MRYWPRKAPALLAALDVDTLALKGSIGAGELDSPHDLVFDREGRLLVADSRNDRIAVFEVDRVHGRLLDVGIHGLGGPEGIDADARYIYITNVERGNVEIYDGGDYRRVYDRAGFSRAHDIELGPDGLLYLADPGKHRVVVLDHRLGLHREYTRRAYDFNEPKYLALDAYGFLYVADQHNNLVKILALKDGMIENFIEQAGADSALNRIEGVEVLGSRLWIADTYNNRILRYRVRHRAETKGQAH